MPNLYKGEVFYYFCNVILVFKLKLVNEVGRSKRLSNWNQPVGHWMNFLGLVFRIPIYPKFM